MLDCKNQTPVTTTSVATEATAVRRLIVNCRIRPSEYLAITIPNRSLGIRGILRIAERRKESVNMFRPATIKAKRLRVVGCLLGSDMEYPQTVSITGARLRSYFPIVGSLQGPDCGKRNCSI